MTLREAAREELKKLPFEKAEVSREVVQEYRKAMAENQSKYLLEARRKASKAAEMSRQIVLA
ncbi:MAG: hypothetical protein GF410_18305 [Chitinivibrionales bacterium]|nr:hypothetical protein [Chitinivibrionales bacterium]